MTSKIRTIGIAVLNRGDFLARCVRSVDLPVDELLVVNNGDDPGVAAVARDIVRGRLPNAGLFGAARVEKPDRNLGCGPSWNRILRSTPGPWLICGSDIEFRLGALARVQAVLDGAPDASIVCANGYNAFVLTEIGVDRVGYFDENFYPAYFEDCDHFRRVSLSGAKAVGVPGFEFVHGEAPHWGSGTINSDPALNAKNAVTFGSNRDYYVRKWGGEPGKEALATPFGRAVPLDWWELDPELRARNDIWGNP